MNERTFTAHVSIHEAIQWELHDQTLAAELIDFAEKQACQKLGSDFRDQEVDTTLDIEGDRFAITFAWSDATTAPTSLASAS